MKKGVFYIVSLLTIVIVGLTSCQEVNPFDEAVVTAVKYEKDFEHYVGTPAPRHAWGFDLASSMMGIEGVATRTIYKQEMNVPTTDENGNTVWVPAIELYGKPSDITQEEHDEVFAWFTNHRVNWTNNYANCGDGNTFTGSTKQCDKIAYSRKDEADFIMLDMGSLVTKSAAKIGDCAIGTTTFFNGWIQYVNSDFSDDEVAENGTKYSCSNMDNLKIVDLNGHYQEHLNEFNGGGGYGWGKQANQNAILATNSNFNEIEYSCSADSKYHDKYILVHLIGSNYSGWYLGMDFEGGGQNPNQRVKADGVCNDWIVKITDAGQSMFNPARILCEDLGANDFDFNDIVLDVTATTDNNCTLATFTIKAVGGTVPVRLCYGTENNYVTFSKGGQEELHAIFNDPDMRPINVNASNGVTSTQLVEWKVGFGKEYAEADYNFPNEKLDLQKINFSVLHSNRAEWLTVRNYDESGVVCAPQMICVPVTVEWPEENEPIISHYPKFKDWVANPTKFFWKAESTNTNNNSQNQNSGENNNQQQGSDSNNQNVAEDVDLATYGTLVANASLDAGQTSNLGSTYYPVAVSDLPASGIVQITYIYNTTSDVMKDNQPEMIGAKLNESNPYYIYWEASNVSNVVMTKVQHQSYLSVTFQVDASNYKTYDRLLLRTYAQGINTSDFIGVYVK